MRISECFIPAADASQCTTILPLLVDAYDTWKAAQSARVCKWLDVIKFTPKSGHAFLLPGKDGCLEKVIVCLDNEEDFWAFGGLPAQLPAGNYYIDTMASAVQHEKYLLAWGLGQYCFSRYRTQVKASIAQVRCSVPDAVAFDRLTAMITSIYWVRDLINLPANALNPTALSDIVKGFAQDVGATFSEIVGKDLLAQGYPMIHAVGKGSDDAPRLLEMRWGHSDHPKLVLVGKGVCFDTGGLNLKTPKGMREMKKDMGGAAHVLGLSKLIIAMQLPVQLRVLIPAVENSVSGRAYRPGDILPTRLGITVEVDNTDAEGRLILADALAEAVSESPDLIVDFATLTGAARVALGTEIPGFFSNNDEVTRALLTAGEVVSEPIWPLPLYQSYKSLLDSKVADIANASSSVYGGAITAALFLQQFTTSDIPWLHLDIMAANTRSLPGRQEGGEATGLRAVFSFLMARFEASAVV